MGFQVLAEATGFTGTWSGFALDKKTRGYDADQRDSAHPVAPEPRAVPDTDAARSSYDDISYAKGASALRQLVAWLGWPAFLAGLNDYLVRYRFGSATLTDLLDCLSRASGADVGRVLAAQRRRGHPDGQPPGQAGCASHAGGRPHQVWVGVYDERPDGLTLRARVPVPVPADADAVVLPAAAVWPEPALLLPNDGDLSYCKVRLDPVSQATLASSLSRLADPLSRAVAWNGVRDLVRDGELTPRQYLAPAVRHLPAETDEATAGHVIGYARWTVTACYLPPGLRGADITSMCRDLLGRHPGDDGGEMRLVALRGLIDSASGPDDITALRSWLAAGRVPGDPDLDSQLRWQILLRLTVLGAASLAEIEHDTRRDTTATGRLSAARCQAALPDQDAKQAAWASMLSGLEGALSGYELKAIVQGFWQAEKAELLAWYVPLYFAALAGAATDGAEADGAGGLARIWCLHGFPHHAATVRAAERCLETGALAGSARRLLAGQLKDLRRSVAVRSAVFAHDH